MRIAFLGKGGSGKTTFSAAFANYLHEQNKFTVLVDADVNLHQPILNQLNESEIKPFSKYHGEISSFVKGQRPDFKNNPFISSTPPHKKSNFIRLHPEDEFINKYSATTANGLRLMAIGKYDEKDLGFTCYHGKSDAFILFLNHLLDQKDQYLVVDSVTGIDNLGTSLVYSYDLNLIVVEPTNKSIQVYKDFVEGAKRFNFPINIKVIGNKITDQSDEEFLKENIDSKHLLGFTKKSSHLKAIDQGQKEQFKNFISDNSEIFDTIVNHANTLERDWDTYLQNIKETFINSANAHYNSYYNLKLQDLLDDNFNFKHVI